MQLTCFHRSRPRTGGFITGGTLIVAAASALVLILMSACHSTPPVSGFVESSAERDAESQLARPDGMAPLQPFDEHLYVASSDDE